MSNSPWYSPVFTTNITNPFIKSSLPLTYKELIVWWVSTHKHTSTHTYSEIPTSLYALFFTLYLLPPQLPNLLTQCSCVFLWSQIHVFVTECICLVCMCVRLWMLCLSCVFAQTYSVAVLPPMSDVGRFPIRLPLTHISYFHTSVTALFSSTGAISECFVDYAGPEFRK